MSFTKIEFEAETIFKLLTWQKMIGVVPSAIIGRSKIPPRVAFFSCTAALGRF